MGWLFSRHVDGKRNISVQVSFNSLFAFNIKKRVSVVFCSYGIIPRRHPINVVIGKPIKVDRIESPSSQEIEDLQNKYCQAVRDLYEEYNPIYGDPKLTLEIA